MKRSFEFYEIKSPDDNYGLIGSFETTEQALEKINQSYEYALTQGYDNRHETWVIVCVQFTKEFNEKGEFLKEEQARFVVETAQFSNYENKYVFVY